MFPSKVVRKELTLYVQQTHCWIHSIHKTNGLVFVVAAGGKDYSDRGLNGELRCIQAGRCEENNMLNMWSSVPSNSNIFLQKLSRIQ